MGTFFIKILAAEPGTVELLAPIPELVEKTTTLPEYLSGFFPLLIALAGTLAIVMIVIGGLEYILSPVPGKKEEGKKRISEAIWGLVLALAAYLILRTINPQLISLEFFIGKQPQVEQNTPVVGGGERFRPGAGGGSDF